MAHQHGTLWVLIRSLMRQRMPSPLTLTFRVAARVFLARLLVSLLEFGATFLSAW